MSMKIFHAIDPERFKRMTTAEMRGAFLIKDLFLSGEITLVYSHVDRAVIGSAVPKEESLKLEASKEELASEYFAQRREIGVFNIGKEGTVLVDGSPFSLRNREVLYIGQGSKEIIFQSKDAKDPARFYMASYPAHAAYPTTKATLSDANKIEIGSEAGASKRTIYQSIHPGGIQSCQLVMGFTELSEGNVWNTMAPHTHQRRSEVYMYFDVPAGNVVFHFMGDPQETRTIVIRDGQAVISPVWSIHAGAGTQKYSFVWAMGGENKTFDDMDGITLDELM